MSFAWMDNCHLAFPELALPIEQFQFHYTLFYQECLFFDLVIMKGALLSRMNPEPLSTILCFIHQHFLKAPFLLYGFCHTLI